MVTADPFAVTNQISHDIDSGKSAFQAGVHRLHVRQPPNRADALYQFRLAEGYALKALAQLRALIRELEAPVASVSVERQTVLPSAERAA